MWGGRAIEVRDETMVGDGTFAWPPHSQAPDAWAQKKKYRAKNE